MSKDGIFQFSNKTLNYNEALSNSVEFVNEINGDFEKAGIN